MEKENGRLMDRLQAYAEGEAVKNKFMKELIAAAKKRGIKPAAVEAYLRKIGAFKLKYKDVK